MRILCIGLNFAPEKVGIGKYTGEMVEWLVNNGQTVRVVCGAPYYPDWRVFKGFAGQRYHRETWRGAEIVRCPLYVPRQPNGRKRISHLASFALSSLPVILQQSVFWRPDIIMTIKPTVFAVPSALLAARLIGAKAWLHVQDLEIDAGLHLLGIGDGTVFGRMVAHAERLLLRRFHRISTISAGMQRGLCGKDVPARRQVLFPNWVDLQAIRPTSRNNQLRTRLDLPDDRLIVLYSGNMGEKQGLEIVPTVARDLLEEPIHFLLCGDGAAKPRLMAMSRNLPNISFLPLQPAADLNDLLALGDIHLLPQQVAAESLVLPSKLTGIMAAGRPVVATVRPGSDVANLIGSAGLISPPGDLAAFTQAIARLAGNSEERLAMGLQARETAVREFDKEAILTGVLRDLHELVAQGR